MVVPPSAVVVVGGFDLVTPPSMCPGTLSTSVPGAASAYPMQLPALVAALAQRAAALRPSAPAHGHPRESHQPAWLEQVWFPARNGYAVAAPARRTRAGNLSPRNDL